MIGVMEPVLGSQNGHPRGVGRVGTDDSSVAYAEKTTSWQGNNQEMQCMMRVGVKPDGTVDGLDFVGKMGACQVFMP
jgi:hypothetical protein